MSLRSLHCTNAWHAKSGGISVFYRALLQAAERHRREVVLVVPGDEDRLEEWSAYARIHHVRSPLAPLNPNYRIILPHRYLTRTTHIQGIMRREQPDLIEICDKYSLIYLAGLARRRWVGGLKQRPTLVGHSCERMDQNMAVYLRRRATTTLFARLYLKWIYFAQFDHHLANSDYTADELREASRGHLVRRGVWVMSPGVDTGAFSPRMRDERLREGLLREAGGTADSVLLFYSGRLAPEKNLELLPPLMAALSSRGGRDFRLLVAGEGILRERLERDLAGAAPGRCRLLGHVDSRERLAAMLASSDVFVHPNPQEPFGIAPLEAMASGVPLVAPNTGGVLSYASPDTAWLVRAEAREFAEAVREAASPGPERAERVRLARLRAENFSWVRVTARCFELYDELHAITQSGTARGIPPLFYSTDGNWLGIEV